MPKPLARSLFFSSACNESFFEALKTIDDALRKLGGSLEDVVRTRVFVRQDADWKLAAKAHKEAFGKTRPASTWLVGTFLDPNILVEIEADAVLS